MRLKSSCIYYLKYKVMVQLSIPQFIWMIYVLVGYCPLISKFKIGMFKPTEQIRIDWRRNTRIPLTLQATVFLFCGEIHGTA